MDRKANRRVFYAVFLSMIGLAAGINLGASGEPGKNQSGVRKPKHGSHLDYRGANTMLNNTDSTRAGTSPQNSDTTGSNPPSVQNSTQLPSAPGTVPGIPSPGAAGPLGNPSSNPGAPAGNGAGTSGGLGGAAGAGH